MNSVAQVNPPCASRLAIIDGCEETIIFQHDYSESETTKVNCLGLFTYLRMRMDINTNIVKGITQAQIAGDLGVGRMTLLRTLKALKRMGLLTWTGCTKQTSIYALRPRPSRKREPAEPVIGHTTDTNPGGTNAGISHTEEPKKGLLVTPERHTSDQRSNDDDDDQSPHHRNVARAKTANRPATKTSNPLPELPAAWRNLRLSDSLNTLAQKCLERGDWQEENLLAAYERSQGKTTPISYLAKCLRGDIPTEASKREVARSYQPDLPQLLPVAIDEATVLPFVPDTPPLVDVEWPVANDPLTTIWHNCRGELGHLRQLKDSSLLAAPDYDGIPVYVVQVDGVRDAAWLRVQAAHCIERALGAQIEGDFILEIAA